MLLLRHKVTDPSCGLRAMKADVTGSVVLDQPQYQASELLIGAAMAGYRLAEVPIAMEARQSGKTKKGGNFLYGVPVRFRRGRDLVARATGAPDAPVDEDEPVVGDVLQARQHDHREHISERSPARS